MESDYEELARKAEDMLSSMPDELRDAWLQSHVADASQCLYSLDSETRDGLADALLDAHKKSLDDKG